VRRSNVAAFSGTLIVVLLPAPLGPEQAHDLADAEGERNIVQDGGAVVRKDDLVEMDNRFRQRCASPGAAMAACRKRPVRLLLLDGYLHRLLDQLGLLATGEH
jgi:hypothetical protein